MATFSAASSGTPRDAARQAAAVRMADKDLDAVFIKLREDVTRRSSILDKQLKTRVRAWLNKLSEEKHNDVWKKNRNAYAKLLLEQLKAGRLEEPFGVVPPSAPLPTLPKSLTYAYSKRKSPVSSSSGGNRTPSEQLDRYLGLHGAAPLPYDMATATPASRSRLPFHPAEMSHSCSPSGRDASGCGHSSWHFAPTGDGESDIEGGAAEYVLHGGGGGGAAAAQSPPNHAMSSQQFGLAWDSPQVVCIPTAWDSEAISAVLERVEGTGTRPPLSATERGNNVVRLRARVAGLDLDGDLPNVLDGFKGRTKALQERLGSLSPATKAAAVAGSIEARLAGLPAGPPTLLAPQRPLDADMRPSSAGGGEVRHTLKSAAAATARARQRSGDDFDAIPRLRTVQKQSPSWASYKPTTGSTTALISEVAA